MSLVNQTENKEPANGNHLLVIPSQQACQEETGSSHYHLTISSEPVAAEANDVRGLSRCENFAN